MDLTRFSCNRTSIFTWTRRRWGHSHTPWTGMMASQLPSYPQQRAIFVLQYRRSDLAILQYRRSDLVMISVPLLQSIAVTLLHLCPLQHSTTLYNLPPSMKFDPVLCNYNHLQNISSTIHRTATKNASEKFLAWISRRRNQVKNRSSGLQPEGRSRA